MEKLRETFGTHANTAHVWAQQTYPYGRAGDRRIFFEGETIYSYGRHFPMAQFTEKKLNGKRIVLVNRDRYSVSTSQHQAHVDDALRGLNVVGVDVPTLPLRDKADKRAAFYTLCERLADAIHAQTSERDWQRENGLADESEFREQIAAFRRVFGVRWPTPRDPVTWSCKRAAEAKRKKQTRKIEDARRLVSNLRCGHEAFGEPDPDARAYAIEDKLRLIEQNLTKLRSARLTLGKAGRFPNLVKRASATLKAYTPIRDNWRAALEQAETREERERDLSELRTIEREGGLDRRYQSPHTLGRLWALALAENMPSAAALIGRKLQTEMLLSELPRPIYRPYWREEITREQWYEGVGSAYAVLKDASMGATLVRRKGEHLETSRGAVVPWRSAVRAFEFAQKCRRAGQAWERNGHKVPVGPYQLDAIDADGNIRAGCHSLAWAEIQACAVREIPGETRPTFPLPVPLEMPTIRRAIVRARCRN